MIFPITIQKRLSEVESIIKSWPVDVHFDNVLKWIMQFDTDDFDLAIKVIENLNVIGFEDLNNALTIAYSKLQRMADDKGTKINTKNTLFAGVGDSGKSGAMIGYNFRLINEISEENFLDEKSIDYLKKGKIENIVLVDDIISTGNQASNEIKKLMETLIPLGVKNIFLLTAVGMRDGISKISEETNAHIFSAFEYDLNDTVKSLDSKFYEGIPFEKREILKNRIEYYGKKTSKSPLGYGGVGGLIVFYYNTPNSTLPIIWSNSSSWIPLFKRVRKINGIESYYKQFDSIEPDIKKKTKDKSELTLFVEGKTDETFFTAILQRLINSLNVKKINIIPLGGFYSSKLLDNLGKSSSQYIFLPEEDNIAPRAFKERHKQLFQNKPHLFIKPIIAYFQLDKILESNEFGNYLPKIKDAKDLTNNRLRREIEMRLFRRLPLSKRDYIMSELVAKYLDDKEIEKLIQQIKNIYDEL